MQYVIYVLFPVCALGEKPLFPVIFVVEHVWIFTVYSYILKVIVSRHIWSGSGLWNGTLSFYMRHIWTLVTHLI